jgi:plastocyanin
MRQIAILLVAVVGLASNVAGGNIDGKIAGWSRNLPVSEHPGVVWLVGPETRPISNDEPVMAQHGGQFVPSFLIVVAGQTVTMPNDDQVAHNVYSLSASKQFDLGFYAKGEHKTVTFERPGLVDVQCLIHSFMRGKILVVPNRYYSIIAADGTFHIGNVPAGKFSLTFWADGMTAFIRGVSVPSGAGAVSVHVSWPDASPSK